MFIDINKVKKVLMVVLCGIVINSSCFGGGGKDDKSEDKDKEGVLIGGVTKTIEIKPTKYTSLKSTREARNFAMDLTDKKKGKVMAASNSGEEMKISDVVKLVLRNTLKDLIKEDVDLDNIKGEELVDKFKDSKKDKAFFVSILWTIQSMLIGYSVNSSIYCLNLFHKIAKNSFEKARLLLLSQCDQNSSDEYIPRKDSDREVMKVAINMLKYEKDGYTKDADELLKKLKDLENTPYGFGFLAGKGVLVRK
ncbi:MAG: hypothetical protein LBB20_00625 [Puniceicoccales bacterium]|jgi:hypothetical protein|nr:hypothetical protein [Puniceicoccales bacterium]